MTLEFRIIRSVFELSVAFREGSGLAAGNNMDQDKFQRKRSRERTKNNDSKENLLGL